VARNGNSTDWFMLKDWGRLINGGKKKRGKDYKFSREPGELNFTSQKNRRIAVGAFCQEGGSKGKRHGEEP